MSMATKRPQAVEASSSGVAHAIQEPAIIRQNKRLRLTIKKANTGVSICTFTNCLETVQNSNEALQLLIQISDALQYNDEDLPEAIQKICEHFRRETQSAVRVKILALLSEFATESCSVEGVTLVDDIVVLMASEKSPKVVLESRVKKKSFKMYPFIINRIGYFARTAQYF